MTAGHRDMLMDMYRAFNDRDLDAATEFLAPEVDWPNGLTGGREHGRSAVRAYWTKLWKAFDPQIEPLRIEAGEDGLVRVRVHQLVRALDGSILDNRKVEHVYAFDGAFIARMTIVEAEPDPDDEDDDDGDGDGDD